VHRSLAMIADSDDRRRTSLAVAFARIGCEVRDLPFTAGTVDTVRRLRPDLVLIGLSAASESEVFAAVAQIRQTDRRLPILLAVHDGSEGVAVEALRRGVKDYFRDPLDPAAVAASAQRCLSSGDRRRAGGRDAGVLRGASAAVPLVGESASIRRTEAYLTKVAQSEATVLITGETGTGKELAAALIHARSLRSRGRFVSVNCAAIPDGLLESELFGHESGAFTGASGAREGLLQLADRGTVFFDEIGDMGALAQAKILRAIESREVYRLGGTRPISLDVRFIAATNQDVERAVSEGRFRPDLYFRLNVARVHLPPLRERRADIVTLLDHYLQDLNQRSPERVQGFAPEALKTLRDYDWPGNVRELKNLVEAVFVCPPPGPVEVGDLPETIRRRLRAVCALGDTERQRLTEALFAANWNKSRAAEILHWSRMTLYRKMAKYSVVRSRPESGPLSVLTAP
jgi:DNA-binding NtrC family response regulator